MLLMKSQMSSSGSSQIRRLNWYNCSIWVGHQTGHLGHQTRTFVDQIWLVVHQIKAMSHGAIFDQAGVSGRCQVFLSRRHHRWLVNWHKSSIGVRHQLQVEVQVVPRLLDFRLDPLVVKCWVVVVSPIDRV